MSEIRWSTINIGGKIDAVHAKFAFRFSFEPHWHEEFNVGQVFSGIMQFNHDGKTEYITNDKVIIVNAGEVHAGEVRSAEGFGGSSLGFRMFYIPESSFREVVTQRTKLPGSLHFSQTVLSDQSVSRDLSKALHALDSDASLLARQGMLLNIMAVVVLGQESSTDLRHRAPLTVHVSTFTTTFLTMLVWMTLARKRVSRSSIFSEPFVIASVYRRMPTSFSSVYCWPDAC